MSHNFRFLDWVRSIRSSVCLALVFLLGAIGTSHAYVTWTQQPLASNQTNIQAVAFGSQYVSVGDSGKIFSSPNGVTWTARVSSTTEILRSVVWTGNGFVAGGDNGVLLTSPDGVTWNLELPVSGVNVRGIAVKEDQIVFVGNNGAIRTSSLDLSERAPVVTGTNQQLNAIIWTGSQYVVVGDSGIVFVSPDGETWGRHNTGDGGYNILSVVWTGGQLVTAAQQGRISTSPDGVIWTSRISGSVAAFTSIAWTGGRLVVVGERNPGFGINNAPIFSSPNGITWTTRLSGLAQSLNGIVWGRGKLVAVGTAGSVLTSPVAVPHISYVTPQIYSVGLAAGPLSPSNSGSAATSWSITPDLAANTGLTFNTSTGVISGTPTLASAATKYLVTALNAEGNDTASVNITTALLTPPTDLSYTLQTSFVSVNVGMTMNRATVTGGQLGLSFVLESGSLPAGLNLNPANGNIYGTPTEMGSFSPVVRVSNSGGFVDKALSLTVRSPSPSISYTPATVSYPINSAISTFAPNNSGGVVTSWSITPNLTLNTGLLFNTTTGKITGTPTVASVTTDYIVTATGPGGHGSDTLHLTVLVNAPLLAFASDTVRFARGAEITAFRPNNTGGPVLAWSISLGSNGNSITANTGLLFNPTTGKILGTPVYLASPVSYTVTATGLAGSQAQAVITIAIQMPSAKSGLTGPEAISIRVTGRAGSIYSLPIPEAFGTAERINVSLADLSGRIVWSKSINPRIGSMELSWNGKTADGREVSAGMYTVRVTAVENGKSKTVSERTTIGL